MFRRDGLLVVVLTMGSWFFAGCPDSYCQHDHSALDAGHLEKLLHESLRGARASTKLVILSAQTLQEPSDLTLADFLVENEGNRCVVVLDVSPPLQYIIASLTLFIQEIEKTENETILSSLLMPWELGSYLDTVLITARLTSRFRTRFV